MQNRPLLNASGSFNQKYLNDQQSVSNPNFAVGSPAISRAPSGSYYQPAGAKVDLADRTVYTNVQPGNFVASRPPSVGAQQYVVRNEPVTTITTGPQVAVARPQMVASNRYDAYEPQVEVKKNPCGNICWGLLGLLGLAGLILGILFGVGVIGSKRTDIQNVSNAASTKSSSGVADWSNNGNSQTVNTPNVNVNVPNVNWPNVNLNTQPIINSATNTANNVKNTVSNTVSNAVSDLVAIPSRITPTVVNPIVVGHKSLRRPTDVPQSM